MSHLGHFGDSRYLAPCESLMSRDDLLAAVANSVSVLHHGATFDGHSMRLESHLHSTVGSKGCLDSWDQPGPNMRASIARVSNRTRLETDSNGTSISNRRGTPTLGFGLDT